MEQPQVILGSDDVRTTQEGGNFSQPTLEDHRSKVDIQWD
jgi:hypothetical protein